MYRSCMVAAGALFVFLAPGSSVEWEQRWRLKLSKDPENVHLSIERSKPGSRWVHSSDVPLKRFRGLSAQSLLSRGAANFEYAGDAGRLQCEGEFNGNGGGGRFVFGANGAFTAELQRLGYDAPPADDLLSMLLSEVTLDFARKMRDSGVASTTRELLEMRIHGVTDEYLDGIRSGGYPGLRAKDYIELRIHGVTPDLVRELKSAGYDVPAKQIVEMRIHGVSPEYIRELKSFGLRPSAAEVVEMRIHGVRPDYLKGMHEAGYSGIPVKEILSLRLHGVSVDFAKEAAQLGFRFTTKELTDLRIHGVSGPYLRRLKDSGYRNLTAANIVRLRVHGID